MSAPASPNLPGDSDEPRRVVVPLLNPNETDALVVEVLVADGQEVKAGDPICEIETTKSTAEICAEADGYVVGLRVHPQQIVQAGETICWVADRADATVEAAPEDRRPGETVDLPAGLRITEPALALATSTGVDLASLPLGPLVTTDVVRRSSGERAAPVARTAAATRAAGVDPGLMVVYGGGGHGRTIVELLRALRVWRVTGIVDDGLPVGEAVLDTTVLGNVEVLDEVFDRGCRFAANAVGGITDVRARIVVDERLEAAGFSAPALVHPTATVEASASLAPGCQVLAGSYVGASATVGRGTIVNTRAVVSHDCRVGEHVHVAPGALLAGGVDVGDRALVGMGVTVTFGTSIGADSRIGNAAVVTADVPARGIVRAGTVWSG